jgi:glycosyltransferase involved in cell wall biosynthesis
MAEMKTILQISASVNSGSTGRIAEEIGQLAIANGWNSYIAYGRRDRHSQSKKIKVGNKLNLYWHILITRLFDQHGLGSKRATQKLIKQIQIIKPDIIHLHNIHSYYLNYQILFNYLKESDIPVVWTLHDCWSFTGHCSHFTLANCYKWKSECYACPQKKGYPKSIFIDNSKNNYNKKKRLFTGLNNMIIVTPSQWLANLASESFINKYSLRIINNGVDLSVFKPRNTSRLRDMYAKDKSVLLGVASTWTNRKGLNDFIKLSKVLPENVQIILVGLNKQQKENLSQSIIGIERTESIIELSELYSLADIHLALSGEETFGMTIAESMACGTPVITYGTSATAELISENTGMVVENGNTKQILYAIGQILSKGKIYYTTHCVNRAKELYNKNDRFEDYINLYTTLCDSL